MESDANDRMAIRRRSSRNNLLDDERQHGEVPSVGEEPVEFRVRGRIERAEQDRARFVRIVRTRRRHDQRHVGQRVVDGPVGIFDHGDTSLSLDRHQHCRPGEAEPIDHMVTDDQSRSIDGLGLFQRADKSTWSARWAWVRRSARSSSDA